MSLVTSATRRPLTVLVVVIAVVLGAIVALRQMPRDVFPPLGIPTIYAAQSYGGKDPARAMAETVNYVNRGRSFMPPGTVPPFVMRFDAGSAPVGDLVFSSETRSVGEMQDLALNCVRPLFATLPGVSAPPPFGGSQRTIVINVKPDRLRAYNMSPGEIVTAISAANVIRPSGNMTIHEKYPMVPLNSVMRHIQDWEDVSVRTGAYPTVLLRDVAEVVNGSDIITSYALVNGRRTVYVPVTMGVNTWAAFGGTDDNAIVDGDFAVTEDELQLALKSLRAGDINIVAIHNHMTHEEPRILFLHYSGKGKATDLAQTLKTALDTEAK